MSTEQANQVSRLKDQKAKIENEYNLLQQRILDFQSESKKLSEDFNKDLSRRRKGVLEDINLVLKNVDKLTQELKDFQNKTLVAEKGSLNDRLETLLGQITNSVEKLQKKVVNITTKQEEDISVIYSEMAGKVNTGLNDIYSSQRGKISEFEGDISNWLANIQREIVSLVERETTSLREMTENIASSFTKTLDEFKERIISFSDVKEVEIDKFFSGTVTDSISRMEIAKEDLLAGIDGLKYKLEENLKKQKDLNEELKKETQEIVLSAKSDIISKVNNIKTEHIENWNSYQEAQLNSLSSFREKTENSFQNALKKNEELESKIFSELQEKLRISFTQLQERIISDVSQVFNDFDATREKTSSSLISSLDNRFNGINRSFISFGKDKVVSQIEKTVTDLDIALSEFFDTTKKGVLESIVLKDNTWNDLHNTLNDQFKEIQAGQEKNIETTLTDIKNAFRSKQSELITLVANIVPAADDHIESNRSQIEEIKSEMSRTRSTEVTDIKKQITGIERDGLTAIQNIIQSTQHKLDENVRESEEAAKELVIGLEDQHKESLGKFRANSSQEIDKHLSDLNNYRENLKEKFTTFFNGQQASLDQFIDDNKTRHESIDDHRRQLDIKLEELNRGIGTVTETVSTNINTNANNVISSIKQIITTVDDAVKTIK
ncbi:MAG: hypothetical protein ACFE95_15970 [Candidatus Hodarchaeota archaeon]